MKFSVMCGEDVHTAKPITSVCVNAAHGPGSLADVGNDRSIRPQHCCACCTLSGSTASVRGSSRRRSRRESPGPAHAGDADPSIPTSRCRAMSMPGMSRVEAHRAAGSRGANAAVTPTAPPAPAVRRPSRPMDRDAVRLGLADFERIALERNPTLKQAAAQFEAALNRSHQAGLYPNPVVGYVQDQIGSFSESMPTTGGFAVRGKPSPGDNVGAFIQWQIVTAGKLRLSRAKFAEEATAARWQAIAQELRVLNGVRIAVLRGAGGRAVDRASTARSSSWMTTPSARRREMFNVGQAGEPEVIQARVQERRAKVALQKAENRFRGDWEELVSLVGSPGLRPTPLETKPLEAEVAPLSFRRNPGRAAAQQPGDSGGPL